MIFLHSMIHFLRKILNCLALLINHLSTRICQYIRNCKVRNLKFRKIAKSNRFQHDCLIRHTNMIKINCQVRKPKVRKLISSALYLGRTLQFFHIISAKKDELCSNSKGCASCWVMSWHLASSSHERSSKKLVDCHYTMKALTEQWEFDTLSNVLTSGEHILWTVK